MKAEFLHYSMGHFDSIGRENNVTFDIEYQVKKLETKELVKSSSRNMKCQLNCNDNCLDHIRVIIT